MCSIRIATLSINSSCLPVQEPNLVLACICVHFYSNTSRTRREVSVAVFWHTVCRPFYATTINFQPFLRYTKRCAFYTYIEEVTVRERQRDKKEKGEGIRKKRRKNKKER